MSWECGLMFACRGASCHSGCVPLLPQRFMPRWRRRKEQEEGYDGERERKRDTKKANVDIKSRDVCIVQGNK